MCGRINIDARRLTDYLTDLFACELAVTDDANLSPTQSLAVLRGGADGQISAAEMRWWLTPHWAKAPTTEYSMFNAKAETAATSPAFRRPYRRQRCVIPVSGYYEWQRDDNGKQPFYIYHADRPALFLAGLWDAWSASSGNAVAGSRDSSGKAQSTAAGSAAIQAACSDKTTNMQERRRQTAGADRPLDETQPMPPGVTQTPRQSELWSDVSEAQSEHQQQSDLLQPLLSCTLLTTAAHPSMARIHHRQPVFLTEHEAQQWLTPNITTESLQPLLASRLPHGLNLRPVSTYVNNARQKGPRCLQPIGEERKLTG